ncbi:GNAT family N-acetyltransferase [Alkalihalophilus lindianensis]|uniref:GNAT family N-acetyltransferase n=1 Tax=Alkalihalophilus lindianensis TaxID=1630542 RepID=A0ABU3X6Y7_9BACI|nr:GNAT family N-acetyltransferase [Alkalihalophilus lindianensis]MDV2683656.1 GNAT family N-acetyltransferase [Alkalihalophilus lindianensis]
MNIITLKEEQYIEAMHLSEYAFQYKVTEERIPQLIERMKKHQILYGILNDQKVAAKLHLLPHYVYLQGEKWKMGGIAGVATYPEYRRNGYVKALLSHSLEAMKSKGMTLSMLHPFDVAFYRKYGWELFSNRLTTTLKKSDLKRKREVSGKIKRWTPEGEHPDLSAIYERYASQFSGMLVRDAAWWKSVVIDKQVAVYYDQSGSAKGFMLYVIKDSKMIIEEIIPLNAEARVGLWNFICQHDSMVEEVKMITHEQEPLFFSLDEPRVESDVKPYFMVRIVDMEAFIRKFSFKVESLNKPLRVSVTDSFAQWNNKTFVFSNQGIKETEEDADIHISTQHLATICFGYKRPAELVEAGLIEGTVPAVEELEKLIPYTQPFFYDFF